LRYILAYMEISFGISQAKEHIQAVNEAVGHALIGLKNTPPSLAIIFTSSEFAHPLVLKATNNLLGEIPIIGSSSQGIITNKGIFNYGFAILLVSLSTQTFFNTASVKNIDKESSLAAGENLATSLLYGFKNVHRSLSIIFSDKLITDGTNLINGVQEGLGRSFPLIGASSADNFAAQKTFQYINNELLSGSCSGILFGGKFNFGFGVKHGWLALGKMRIATESNNNVIHQIDGVPAAKLYEDYFAKDIMGLAKELHKISISYPIGVYLPGEKEYLLRNIVSIKDDGSLVTRGDIPQGSKIRLMVSTKESRLGAVSQACQEAQKNLAGLKAKFVIVFDSAARSLLLGRQNQAELEVIKEEFGKDTPIIGMYTNGEQAPLKSINYLGRTYFHNQSINIIAIGD